MPPRRSLAEQLARAANPQPEDVDPEDYERAEAGGSGAASDSDASASDDESDDRTAHYVDVGRAQLRDDGIALSEGKYAGSRVSRDALDASDESSDEDAEDTSDDSDANDSDSDRPSGASESESESEDNDKPRGSGEAPRSASGIAQVLSSEQKALLSRLSADSQNDVSKGRAVAAQMKVYEGLLDLRIQTQKILNITNKANPAEGAESVPTSDGSELLPLLNRVLKLRDALSGEKTNEEESQSESQSKSSNEDEDEGERAGRKRKRSLDDVATAVEKRDAALRRRREAVLTKWSRKVELSSGRNAMSGSLKALGQSAALQVSTVLGDLPRLVKRTQVDRSQYGAAPEFLYDDTDFYRLLLKELVDRRMADGASGAGGLKWKAAVTKQHRIVDTKASKGRKLRYAVMEKIQGFDAPRNVFAWTDRQAEDLYAGLLGVRISMDDAERERDDDDEQPEEVEVGDFNLFG